MTPRLPVFCLLSAVLCLPGCAHYQLGTEGKLGFTTLYVAPVANKTLLPQAQAIVSTQLREAFIKDARVTLVDSAADADATLSVTITDYHREVTAAREDDTGLARKFALTLGTTCTLRDNRSGKELFAKRAVSVQRDAYTDSGQLQSEYQTLPLLADALAQKISHTVLDVW
jgi:hypothetical protein